jgi:ABC-type transport system substrate-binding protein
LLHYFLTLLLRATSRPVRIHLTEILLLSPFSSKRFPPDGANRGHYRNAHIDALTDQIRLEMNQEKRKALCSEVKKIFAEDLPYLPLWFNDSRFRASPLARRTRFAFHWKLQLSCDPTGN